MQRDSAIAKATPAENSAVCKHHCCVPLAHGTCFKFTVTRAQALAKEQHVRRDFQFVRCRKKRNLDVEQEDRAKLQCIMVLCSAFWWFVYLSINMAVHTPSSNPYMLSTATVYTCHVVADTRSMVCVSQLVVSWWCVRLWLPALSICYDFSF